MDDETKLNHLEKRLKEMQAVIEQYKEGCITADNANVSIISNMIETLQEVGE
jgi:hypothetical protein